MRRSVVLPFLLLVMAPSGVAAQRATRADSLKAYNDSVRVADSTRIANRPCTIMDQFVGLCPHADTVYADRKAVAVRRRPGTRAPAPIVDTVYYDPIRPPVRRVDTVYVAARRFAGSGARVDTVYVDPASGKVLVLPACVNSERRP